MKSQVNNLEFRKDTLDNLYLDRALSILVKAPSHCSTFKQTYLPAIHRYLNRVTQCVWVCMRERLRETERELVDKKETD